MIISGVFASSESEDEEESTSTKKFTSFIRSDGASSSTEPTTSSRQSRRFEASTNSGPIGTWEKHTKGIGAKLLAKMGYKPGLGLGKELQGITAPIDAKLRPSGVGLGLVQEHKPKVVLGKDVLKTKEKDEEDVDMDLASDYEGTDDEDHKRRKRKKKKKEYVTKSAEDILTERMCGGYVRSDQLSIMSTKVIDMRGPESRVLSSYHEIDVEKLENEREGNEREGSVELRKNERDLVMNQAEMRRLEIQLDNLNEQRKSIKKMIHKEKLSLCRLEAVREIGERVRKESHLTPLELVQMYHDCKESYGQEMRTFNLDTVFRGVISESVRESLVDWKPLSNPTEHREMFSRMKSLLLDTDRKLFEKILWNQWMMRVRREMVSWGSMKECREVIEFLERWKPVMPRWLLANVMDQILLPRIEREVESWNPCSDPVPVHSWILPWLPLTGDDIFSPVFATIRRKLSQALRGWHASDVSAKLILEPWKPVFSPDIWDSFLSSCIIPKLSEVIAELVINPHDQKVDNWSWFMSWYPLASPVSLSQVLCHHFFPRWLQVLHHWLNNSPDLSQVSHWYSGWKAMIPQEMLDQQPVQAHFLRAQKMMYDAVNGLPVVLDCGQNQQVRPEQVKFRQQLLSEAASTSDSIYSFKQLVSEKADRNGIIFMPVSNKYHEGKQVYQLGNDRVYLDRSVIFLHNPETKKWNPTSLSTLLPD